MASDAESDFGEELAGKNFLRPRTPETFSWWGDRMKFGKDGLSEPQISKPADRTAIRVRERGSTVGSSSTRLSQRETRQRQSPHSRMPTRGTAVTGLALTTSTSDPVTQRSQWTAGTADTENQPLKSVDFETSREWESGEVEREKASRRHDFRRSLSGQRLLSSTPGAESALTPSTSPRRTPPSSSKSARHLPPKEMQNIPHDVRALSRMATATPTAQGFVEGRKVFNYHGRCHFQANPWGGVVPRTSKTNFPPGHTGDFRSLLTRKQEGGRARFEFQPFALTTDGKNTTSLPVGPQQDRMVTWAGGRFFCGTEKALPGWNYSTKTRGAGWTTGPLILPEQDDVARFGIERKFKPLALKLMQHNFRSETVAEKPPLELIFNRNWTTTDRLQTKVMREKWYQYPLERSINGLPYQEDALFRTWD